jgi:hypothetical protein
VPVLNSVLHRLRCRENKKQQLPKNDSTDCHKSTSAQEYLNTANTCSLNLEENSDISCEQWECSYCTFLNDTEKKWSADDHIMMLQCSMCHNTHDPLLGATWRESTDLEETEGKATSEEEEEHDQLFDALRHHTAADSKGSSDEEYSNDDSDYEYDDSDDDESLGEDLTAWTCSYCTTVNLSCEHSCQVCDMPSISVNASASARADADGNTSGAPHPPSQSLLRGLETTVPALCYMGLTMGALLTDSAGGSVARSRNGLIGSLVGTMAGMAVAVLMNSPDDDDDEVGVEDGLLQSQQNLHVSGGDTSAADRLPVHRYQLTTDTDTDTDTDTEKKKILLASGTKESKRGVAIKQRSDDDKVTCRICMEEYVHNVEIKTMKCFHMFHAECIDQWLGRKTSCPLCCTSI